MKVVAGWRGQRAQTVLERGPQVRLRLRCRGGPEELRVVLFLEEHGHEPIVELQFPRAENAAPGFVVVELALAFEHGIAHARTAGERGVEGLDEAARRLDEDAMAHGHHGGHADLQQLRGDGFRRLLGRSRLAGFEEDERDAVLVEQRAELVGEHGEVAALVELAGVLRILEAKAAEPGTAVEDAVAIEVDDVIGPGLAARPVEFLAQRRQRRRTQHMDVHEAAERLHRFDKGQRTDAMIDETAGFVLRARGDEQDADGRGDHGHLEIVAGVRQAPPDCAWAWLLETGNPSHREAIPTGGRARPWRPRAPLRSPLRTHRPRVPHRPWTENRRPTCPSIRSHAFKTFPVCSAGRAAACRSCPHFTRFASTLRARSRK